MTTSQGPPVQADEPLQVQASNLDYSEFTGRIAVGRIYAGTVKAGQQVAVVKGDGETITKGRVQALHRNKGLGKEPVEEASAGDIIHITGIEGIDISDTICAPEAPAPCRQFRSTSQPFA